MKAHRSAASLLMAVSMWACSDLTGVAPVGVPVPAPTAGVALEVVAQGLRSPVFLTAPAGNFARLFIVEKPGRIRIIRDGIVLPTPFLDIESEVSDDGERGLLSLAFHPNFSSNGLFFINHTDIGGDTRIVRFSAAAGSDVADPGSAVTVLSIPQPFANHNGGQIAFGPDGMLYVGMGDGGSGGDPLGHGQNRSTLLGSILRIDVDGGNPFVIPNDNPFVGDPDAAAETWVYGLRNPWRFSFDRLTGDLYIGDVGQSEVEEISVQSGSSPGGENFGWNTMEGSRCFGSNSCDATGLVAPVHEYTHSEGCSVTGGYVYRGTAIPSVVGRYFFADFCGDWIRSFRLAGDSGIDLMDHTTDLGPVSGISSFGEDSLGELYIISIAGTVYRMVAS